MMTPAAWIAVLALALYGRAGFEAFWALGLAGLLWIVLSLLVFFLRLWLSAAWTRNCLVVLAAVAAQVVWIKLMLATGWVLAVLGLLLPAVEDLRSAKHWQALALQAVFVGSLSLAFLMARSGLETTGSVFFWEHPAGLFGLAGLLALAAALCETREKKAV